MPAKKGARKGQRKQLEWRRDPDIIARLERVEPLHLAGWSSTRIATELGVSERTIRNDVTHLSELWVERLGATQEALRGRIVAQLDMAIARAFEAADDDWQCTRAVLFGEPYERNGHKLEIIRDLNGAARFSSQRVAALNAARQAVVDKAKVLGLIIDKVAQTDGAGNDLSLADLANAARAARAVRESQTEGT